MDIQKSSLFSKSATTLIFTLMVVLVAFFSCVSPGIYDHSEKIPAAGWHKDSVVFFHVEIEDTISRHNFYINLRHSDTYAYRNFYIFLNSRLPDGRITRDTIEVLLADKEGKWFGKGFGALRDYRFEVRNNLVFPLKGQYSFWIEQAMREDQLTGISDIGIRID